MWRDRHLRKPSTIKISYWSKYLKVIFKMPVWPFYGNITLHLANIPGCNRGFLILVPIQIVGCRPVYWSLYDFIYVVEKIFKPKVPQVKYPKWLFAEIINSNEPTFESCGTLDGTTKSYKCNCEVRFYKQFVKLNKPNWHEFS